MDGAIERILAILREMEPKEARKVLRALPKLLAQPRNKKAVPLLAADVSPLLVNEMFGRKCVEPQLPGGRLNRFDPRLCPEVDKIGEGLKRVSFDFENCDYTGDAYFQRRWGNLIGPRYFGKVAGIGCCAGGDWEYPVFFIIYLDPDGETLRSYVPKNGNTWNYDTGSAFGNNGEKDEKFISEWIQKNIPNAPSELSGLDLLESVAAMFDAGKIVLDIQAHIRVMKGR